MSDNDALVRAAFPVLGSQGAKVDWQFVADHGKQAQRNHYQTVERLAQRGGLSWCELAAVIENREYKNMDTNDAIVAVRSAEAEYLAALRSAPQAEPLDLPAQDEVEVVARAIHEHLSRRDIMQYLDNDEDCRGLATAAIAALDRHRAGDDALREENARLRAVVDALAVLMPIQVHDGRDYAEVFFADGATHSTQAMTMNPQHWRDLTDAYDRAALTGRQG